MPCWYFDRQQIKNSPSFLDGIDTNTENRYRREGARFIIDAGTKMGLRWDTFATGVVYFHRFYMFHSFKEFYRYVTAACCLFLAGKVEETPKKCKDIIKIAQNLLSSSSFLKFGEDPREEVMTMERILLKTIKFDLQVEHPYAFLLKYAKNFKSEEDKVQNMAQMAWTFMNDSLCTTLCLQWEPEIVGVSLMYLASRFTKFEPSDWTGRTSTRSKWWNDFVEGMTVELMEDIGHQMLDLYSHKNKKVLDVDSPPNSPSKGGTKGQSTPPPPPPDRPPPTKRTREEVKSEPEPSTKSSSVEKESKIPALVKPEPENNTAPTAASNDSGPPAGAPIPVAQHRTPSSSYSRDRDRDRERAGGSSYKSLSSSADNDTYSSYNPYVSSRMLSSSFMSQEGSQNIQSILAGNSVPPPLSSVAPYPDSLNPPPSHHSLPPPDTSHYPPPSSAPHNAPPYPYLPPPQSQYVPLPAIPPPHSYPPPSNPPPGFDPYAPPPSSNSSFPPPTTYAPPPVSISAPQHSYAPPDLSQSHSYNFPPTHLPPPGLPPPRPSNYPPPTLPYPDPHQGFGGVSRNYASGPPGSGGRKDIASLTEVKISGRNDWNMNR